LERVPGRGIIAAAAWPLAARAQQGERARWIGLPIGVAEDPETKAGVATFHKRLDELGWRVGGNLQIEERWTAGVSGGTAKGVPETPPRKVTP